MKWKSRIRRGLFSIIILLLSISNFVIAQELFLRHNVDLNFRGACSICSYDLDGDGDLDILGAGHITYWLYKHKIFIRI